MPVAQLDAHAAHRVRLFQTKQKLPLLEDVLALVSGKVPLLIELKNHSLHVGELERAVLAVLQQYKGLYALQSFNAFSLLWLKKNAPYVCRGQLSTGYLGLPLHRLTTPDFIAYNIKFLPRRVTSRLRAKGVPLIAWTIENREQQIKAQQAADNYIFAQSADIMPFV